MNRIKILKNGNLVVTKSNVEITYTPHKIGELPKDFGCNEYKACLLYTSDAADE